MVATGAHIQCSAQAPDVFASALQAPSDVNVANMPSAAICHAATSTTQHQIRQSVGPALISVGPNTDAVLDRFKLGDQILPKLRVLATTIHSSQWESVFRSPKWDLSYKQASLLLKALLADLQGVPVNPDVIQVSNFFVI